MAPIPSVKASFLTQTGKLCQNRKGFALLTLSLALTACHSNLDEGPSTPEVRPVNYLVVETSAEERTRSFPALVSAEDLRELSFPGGGIVESLSVDKAQRVTEGQELARLDARDYQARLESAQARANNAQQEFERAKMLFEQDAISKAVLEQRQAGADVARAELDSAQKALDETRLLAPFDGIISTVTITASQNLAPGTPAIRIFSIDRMTATAALPSSFVAHARKGVSTAASLFLDAAPERPLEASFKEAELEADETMQSYAVTFRFTPPGDLVVLPGMNATLQLSMTARDGADQVRLPIGAVVSESGVNYVWKVDRSSEPYQAKRVAVTIGKGIGETVPVVEGVTGGDHIITAGLSQMVEGLPVRLWSDSESAQN
jgi:RND family efflux transporter MFP subunit